MSSLSPSANVASTVQVDFIDRHQLLLVRADLNPLFKAFEAHLVLHHRPPLDQPPGLFRGMLAAFALHCATRPTTEQLTWTLNSNQPPYRLFLAGDNSVASVIGQMQPKETPRPEPNLFYSNAVGYYGAQPRTSIITFADSDAFALVERYYRESEQRTARLFELSPNVFAMSVSHPDHDERYLRTLAQADVMDLIERGSRTPVETRSCHWECNCSHHKILGLIVAAARDDMAGTFDGRSKLEVACPRCSALYQITRDEVLAFLAARQRPQ